MEPTDYTKLIEFLGRKFEKIDEQFEDMSRHNAILHEDTHHKLDLVIEGLKMHEEKNERDKETQSVSVAQLERNSLSLKADIDEHERRIKVLEKHA